MANAQWTLTYLRILTEEQYNDVVGIVELLPFRHMRQSGRRQTTHLTMVSMGLPYGKDYPISILVPSGRRPTSRGTTMLGVYGHQTLVRHAFYHFPVPGSWQRTIGSRRAFGVTFGGEFSIAIHDCDGSMASDQLRALQIVFHGTTGLLQFLNYR
ncbi:hypothetical protein APHAL10511_004602 [Amanita phalloides]|nr:hypothetical protein APHAL10511_004602 [Amanita phalloides]